MNVRSMALCLALLACPGAGFAQWSVFLWLPGAPGETQDTNHAGWMDISSAGAANLFNPNSGPNPGALRATFESGLAFTKNVDTASPVLALHCGQGAPFALGILDITASTNTATPILRLQLTNVFINLASHSFSSGGSALTEQISLQSQIMAWSYNQIDPATGLPTNNVSSSWSYVYQAPTITSANSALFQAGESNVFTVTASGNPVSGFTETGALPPGVRFVNGVLSGMPTPDADSIYTITITATNGIPPNATQSFNLSVIDYLPVVTIPEFLNIRSSSVVLEAFCNDQGASAVTKMGFLYAPTAVNPNPTLGGTGVVEWDFASPGVAAMEDSVNSLTPATEYSVVTFAVNSYGTAYSAVTNLNTLAGPSGSLVVTTLEDVSGVAGVNSLRDAVNYAYELDDAATITFAPSLFASGPATYVLSGANGPISIANLGGLLTLHGPGAGLLTFDGAGKSAVFSLASASVAMDGMTVANSYGSQSAIELTDSAILSVSNVVFVNNRTSGSGGAINARRGLGLSVDDCTFATNTASSLGGAIDVELAQFEFEVQNSTFVGNVSGVNEDGTTNGSAGNGGAINMSPYYGFRIVNCTFAGNRVFNGSGGALWAGNASASTVHQIADCTLTANAADGAGGGVEYVPNNGGVSYALTLDNSIISGDLAATNADLDINTNHLSGMSLTSQLVVTNNCLMGASVTNLFGTNTLADNGGATETIALNPNGPAINAGDNSVIPAGFTTDQAGQPRINDGTVDIGAYEFQFAAPAITSAGGVIFVAGVSNSFSITASGAPTPVVTVAGTLPAGVSFTNGVLAGTPPSGSSGAYALTLTATNGISPNTAQAFTLTVMGPDPLAIHPGFNTNGFAWSFNGTPAAAGADINNNGFTLTDAGIGGESRSGWFDYPLYVGGFQAAFTYQDVGGGGADGVAFVVQNSPSGRSALGGGGGDLGYVGVTPSVAVLLNLYSGSPGGTGWLLGTNGVGVYNLSYQLDGESYAATTPVNLTGGNPIGVNVRYLAGNLSLSLTDLVTSASFHTNVAVNLPAMIGTNVAYVGFTGGDGGGTSHQIVSNFSYAPLPGVAVNHQGTAVILSWPGSVYGFRLQSCAALSQNDWSFLASTPVQTNSLNQITIPIGPGAVFYRLFLPAP